MSEYRKQTTAFKDRDCLVEALVEMGYKKECIELHETAQQLYDFQNRPTHYVDKKGDRANVIVRRHHVGGAANDLGFKLEADGTYSALISDYDSRKHSASWLVGLKTAYNEKNLIKTGRKLGVKYLGKKVVNGRVQLQWADNVVRA